MPRALPNNPLSFAPWLLCLGVVYAVVALAGCGGSGGGGGGGTQPPAKTTPTISTWPTASAITYGQTLASSTLTGGTASVTGTFAWTTSSTAPSAGTPSESVTFAPSDTTDYNTVAGSVTVTVNKATPTVSAWPTASAITSAQTLASSTLTGGTASVPGTFAWTAPSTSPAVGTDSESVTFTPTDAADYATVTAGVQIVVTQALATTTSITPASIYTDLPTELVGWGLNGTNFLSTDVPSATAGALSGWNVTSSTLATFSLNLTGTNYATGYIGIGSCRAGGSPCTNVVYLPYAGPYYKGLALDNSGELAVLSGKTVYKFHVNGGTLTAAPSENFNQIGLAPDLVVDNKTGDYVIGDGSYTSSGTSVAGPNLNGATDQWSDIAVKDSISGQTRPATDNVSFWNITQPGAALTTIALPTGSQPISIAMANFGTTTRYEYVLARGGGSVLLRLFKNESAVGATSVAFTGATPANSYPVSAALNGYPIVAFESGPAQGTVAVLDVGDGILSTFNQEATQELLNLKLSGTPIGIAKSETDGMILVFYDNAPATGQTTVAAVNALTGFNPSTGQPYARSATSKQYPYGAVVANGYIMLSQGATPDSVPNQ
jgi:hypothetical protein